MSKHQVFLVHGMGNFEPGWSLALQGEIRKTFGSYKSVAALALVDRFEFVEVTYNDVFEKWRKQWKEDADAAAKLATGLQLDAGVASKLVTLAKAPTGDSFFQTHVLDVVMYRYLKQFSAEVCQSVRKQILDRLNAFPKGQLPSWSAVAHSLGTSVLHDTLHAMFTQPVDNELLGDAYMPAYLFMVANVGKVLWNRGGDFYSSVVRPHVVDTMGLCWRYGNFDHQLDPFTHVDGFDPPSSWFPAGVARDRIYADITIPKDDIQELNVHSLSHYWSHPDVHVEIIRSLLDIPEIISSAEHSTALTAWRKNTLKANSKSKAQTELLALLAKKKTPWASVVQRLVDFRSAVLAEGLNATDGES